MFDVADYSATYRSHFQRLAQQPDAFSQAVGGHFEEFGTVMQDLLTRFGLQDSHYLIDVGCGSGRLAHKLTVEHYLGTDVVPELLDNARAICAKPEWRFELVNNIVIPEQDGPADMVCFFSLFTHLLHEDSFRYLREARRVLRPQGRAVFSFLEFSAPDHWKIFDNMIQIRDQHQEVPHTQFIDREGIRLWAEHVGFSVVGFIDADKSGLGQSVCVLETNLSEPK